MFFTIFDVLLLNNTVLLDIITQIFSDSFFMKISIW